MQRRKENLNRFAPKANGAPVSDPACLKFFYFRAGSETGAPTLKMN
jgi:hypothetical protein